MEKLLEYLNEYSKKKHNLAMRELNGELGPGFHYLSSGNSYSELLMISKKYEFIKRLVKNDKIDRERIRSRWGDMSIHFTDEQLFIMELSISDTPIQNLVSFLKNV